MRSPPAAWGAFTPGGTNRNVDVRGGRDSLLREADHPRRNAAAAAKAEPLHVDSRRLACHAKLRLFFPIAQNPHVSKRNAHTSRFQLLRKLKRIAAPALQQHFVGWWWWRKRARFSALQPFFFFFSGFFQDTEAQTVYCWLPRSCPLQERFKSGAYLHSESKIQQAATLAPGRGLSDGILSPEPAVRVVRRARRA